MAEAGGTSRSIQLQLLVCYSFSVPKDSTGALPREGRCDTKVAEAVMDAPANTVRHQDTPAMLEHWITPSDDSEEHVQLCEQVLNLVLLMDKLVTDSLTD